MLRDYPRMAMALTCREAGMRLMATTIPAARSIVLFPLAGTALLAGCALQFAGHSLSLPLRSSHALEAGRDGRGGHDGHDGTCDSALDEATAELLG